LRAWVALAYGFGTLALPYSTALFGHQFGAFCCFVAFLLLWRQREGWSWGRALAAALIAGLGAISDFTTLFLTLFLAGYGVWVASGRAAGRPAPAGVLAARATAMALVFLAGISPQLIANWSSFGNPFTFPHVYHVQEAFRARHTSGLLGVHLPRLYPLYQLTFGSWRGLFHGSPVLMLALPGLVFLWRRWRAEAAFIAAGWLGVLLMSAGYENWTAGSVYGPRYQIAAVPLLMLAAAPAAERWPRLFKALAILSAALMLAVTARSPFVPEDLVTPLAASLGPFARGELLHGNLGKLLGLPGLWSLAPLAALEAVLLFLLSRRCRPAAS